MAETKENPIQRLILTAVIVVLLITVACNLAFVWRNVTLNRQMVTAAARVQQLNQTQQLIPAIAQDLVGLTQQQAWLVPILQKYGLIRVPAPATTAPPAASATSKHNATSPR